MDHATVFIIDKSQAIRLPKAVALPENVKRVRIIKLGQARLITPADALWDSFFDGPRADFMSDLAQLPMQEREGV